MATINNFYPSLTKITASGSARYKSIKHQTTHISKNHAQCHTIPFYHSLIALTAREIAKKHILSIELPILHS